MIIEELMQAFEECMEETGRRVEAFPWEDKRAYGTWLMQSFVFVQHSTRLLALASGFTSFEQEAIHRRMANHLKEEVGHEKMALTDLKRLGLEISDLPELQETNAFFQTQYYWIQQESGASFLGYVIFLEGLAAKFGPHILNRVTEAHGEKASVFVRVHAEEDQDHIEKAFDNLKNLPPEEIERICRNMKSSSYFYGQMLERARRAKIDFRHDQGLTI